MKKKHKRKKQVTINQIINKRDLWPLIGLILIVILFYNLYTVASSNLIVDDKIEVAKEKKTKRLKLQISLTIRRLYW